MEKSVELWSIPTSALEKKNNQSLLYPESLEEAND